MKKYESIWQLSQQAKLSTAYNMDGCLTSRDSLKVYALDTNAAIPIPENLTEIYKLTGINSVNMDDIYLVAALIKLGLKYD